MDPVTTAIVTKSASDLSKAAKEGGKSFLSAVLRPPGEALGGIYADQLNERRHANLIKIAARAQHRLQVAGVTAKQVPLSIIHPALEAASLEENENLQDLWANLLANAADPRGINTVSASFPGMLRELSARDVTFLDALYRHAKTKDVTDRFGDEIESASFERLDVMEIYSMARLSRCTNLAYDSIGAGMEREDVRADMREFNFTLDAVTRHLILNTWMQQPLAINRMGDAASHLYAFTTFGTGFMLACTTPEK